MERSAFIILSLLATIAFMVVGCGGKSAPAASTPPLVEIGAGLQGPEGLTATVYTTGLPKVSAFAFDTEGRLWAATADFQDVGEDGVYFVSSAGATPVKVIEGVHTPLGLLWYNGELYVSSKERVDAYSGFNGKRFTRQRSVVLLPKGVGEDNGIVMSPEGRIVLGISAPCDACVPESEFSGAVVSFLPDGSELRVDASSIRAPIGLAYYPSTSDLFVTMNQRDNLGAATPGDWLALVREGDDWGFPDCYGQGGSACTGAPSPTAELDAHAAVSGVAIVTGQLGSTLGNSAVVAEWATGKLLRVALV
jgi:glucose/arabinose dehydrogenase